MRVRLRPLDGTDDLGLWHARLAWTCRGVPLDLRVLAAETLDLPQAEPSEPVPSAIARCVRAVSGTGALLLLANPAQALGAADIACAEGVRLFGITTPADEACWDALLSLRQPVYGVRGEIVAEVLRPRPANLLSALAFGMFYAHEGLEPLSLDESPQRVAWTLTEPAAASVIGKGGFELASSTGSTGHWEDRGDEGYVRVVIGGRCWTQPRLVAPQ